MNDIVLSFTENGYEYLVYKKGEEYIALKKQDGKVIMELSLDEKKMVNSVFDKLKVKHSVKLPNIEFEGKEYKHFYDKENNFHSFLNTDGSKLTINEFKALNYYYNNQDGIVYYGKQKQKEAKDTIQRIVKIGKKFFIVTMLSSMLINGKQELKALANDNKFETINEVQTDQIDDLINQLTSEKKKESIKDTQDKNENLTDEEKIENLKNALNKNENLTDEEKDFILSGFNVLEKNIDIIDYSSIVERLETLKIVYINAPDPEGKAAGTYTYCLNLITIFNATDYKMALQSVLSHEVYHSYQNKYEYPGLFEVCNAMMNEEYSGSVNNFIDRGYDRRYVIALMEIIGSEPFRYFNFNGDIDLIRDPLLKLINDEDMVDKLLDDLDAYTYLYSTAEKNILMYDIENTIGKFYQAKYGEPINTNKYLVATLWPGAINADTLNESPEDRSYITFSSPIPKGYFNKDLENYQKDPSVCIRVTKYAKKDTYFTIDDIRRDLMLDEKYTDQDVLSMIYSGAQLVDPEKGLYKRESYEAVHEDVPLTDETLLKISKDVKSQIDEIESKRLKRHEEIVYENKIAMAKEEIKDVKDFGVMKIDDIERLVYVDEEGNTVVNIRSEYANKINEKLKGKNCEVTYEIIEELNIVSINVSKISGSYNREAYNIKLSDGSRFKAKKYLRKNNIDPSLLDADAYFFCDEQQLTKDKTIVINAIKHTKGKESDKVTQHSLIPNLIKDGQLSINSEYANKVAQMINDEFKEGYKYEISIYEPNPSYGCVSLIVYDNEKVKVYRFNIGSWEENDLNSFFMLEGNEEENVFIDSEGNAKAAMLIDGQLETKELNYRQGK